MAQDRVERSGGTSLLEAGLDEAFVVAGAVTLGGAVLTGWWLVRSGTADGQGDSAGGRPPGNSDAAGPDRS
ncbi:hypothetical protein OG896_11545 [Streptomyces sp. NBC_00669]|uniref:hypothetical protein n=1 Tax=Streptomyces sp. NBC_00669 TaxID=2976011 RepID=UPI002E36EDC6|nr:hypothetical protein [Streptomyces sp. NBC_00669]